MIDIILWQDRSGHYRGASFSGHAGGQKGSDIVCAAVSALAQTLQLGLQEVLGFELALRKDAESGGLLEFRIPLRLSAMDEDAIRLKKADCLFETFAGGLKRVAEEANRVPPSNHVAGKFAFPFPGRRKKAEQAQGKQDRKTQRKKVQIRIEQLPDESGSSPFGTFS